MNEYLSTTRGDSNWFQLLVYYLELVRFSHTIFALPFALLATAWCFIVPLPTQSETDSSNQLFLQFRWIWLLGIVLCMVTGRSFAMAMNRLLDRKWDAENPRTAQRHLPAGKLSVHGVWLFSLICAIAFIFSSLLFLPNWLPFFLSLPVLIFMAGYSLAKRFTSLAHFWLGAALMLAPVCAWIALRGPVLWDFPDDLLPAVMLGAIVLFWVAGFDIIYACQDTQFDERAGLHSIPARLGNRLALRVAAACHVVMWGLAVCLSFWFPVLSLGWLFRAMLLIIGILLIAEHLVVSAQSMARIQLAFFQLNSIISVLFLVIGTIDAFVR